MKKSTVFVIIGIVLALCLIIAPTSASTITTLAQLQSACTAGGTHELGANITVDSTLSIPFNKTLTLDLKSYNLTSTVNTVFGLGSCELNLNGTTGKIIGKDTITYPIIRVGATDFPAKFTMNGGVITGNDTYYAVFVNPQSTFTMTGGSITGNGYGVFCNNGGTILLKDSPVIKDNNSGNIFLNNSNCLKLNGNLSSSSEIYVNYSNTSGAIIGVHNGYSGVNRIFSDNGLYMGGVSGNNIVWITKVLLSLDDFTTNPPSPSYSPTNKSITLNASVTGTPTSYVWSYTTNPNPSASSSWINIGTTSTNSISYTPTTVGTYTFRVVVYAGSISVDSLSESLKPYLEIFAALNGGGTASNPYQVGSNSDLQNWNTSAIYYNDKYMSITQDFTPATTVSKFSGNLNGNNRVLINSTAPLFDNLGGTISNLTFKDCLVNGEGVLANASSASVTNVNVENCFISGNNTGGLVGSASGSFTDCTVNYVTVKGTEYAGGIAGNGNTIVTRCNVLNSDILAPVSYGICSDADHRVKKYTIRWDESSSTSKNIQWADDAAGLTETQRNDLIKDHSHFAVVKWDGTKPVVNYYLYRDNLNYRATDKTCKTSSGVASNLTGADGDVMLLYDQVWWTTSKSGNYWNITFTWDEGLTDSSWVTPHKYGNSLSTTSLATFVGLGVFEGYVQNNQLRSINTSNTPTGNLSQNNFYTTAISNRNWQYNNQLPMTYAWYIIQLYFVKGDRNTQAAYGNGIVGDSAKRAINQNWSTTNAWNNGTTANQISGVTALGLQNIWGNVREYMGEMRYDNGTVKFSTLGGYDHYNIESGTGSTWKSTTTTYTASSWANVTKISGTPEYPFFPSAASGTTYSSNYADAIISSSNTARCVTVGGDYADELGAGSLLVTTHNIASNANDSTGSRLHVLII